MRVIVDRIEGKYAVVELDDKSTVDLPLVLLPGANEGDIVNITIDKELTEQRREEIKKKLNDLWK